MPLLYLVLLIGCLTGSAVAQSTCQSATAAPAVTPGTIAPEDVAFNADYSRRAIPTVTGRLLNLSPNETNTLTVKYSMFTPFSPLQLTKRIAVG
ncbi:MAG TPA: hypothetical protein VKR41_11450, partial [Puia sp.]|nr:hypothetical protein [Puia sp.]